MITYDIETFRYNWLIVFKDVKTQEYTVIHNDNLAVKEFMKDKPFLAGFNNKFYDNHILKAILCGADNELVKDINDYIIAGNQGFNHWFIKQNYLWIDSTDVRDDMQMGLSLKAIEGHLGMDIEESSVPFDIDRPLTDDELEKTIKYCKHDVDTTERILILRKPYLQGKLSLGRIKGLEDSKSLSATNAKLTALFLDAKAQKWDDEREYVYPTNLKRELIPSEVFEFFDKIHDKTISDDTLFKSKVKINMGGCPSVIGFGGYHGAISNYIEESEEES